MESKTYFFWRGSFHSFSTWCTYVEKIFKPNNLSEKNMRTLGLNGCLDQTQGYPGSRFHMFSSRHFFFASVFLLLEHGTLLFDWLYVFPLWICNPFLYFRPFSAAWLYFFVQSHSCSWIVIFTPVHRLNGCLHLNLQYNAPCLFRFLHVNKRFIEYAMVSPIGFEIGPSPEKCSKNWNVWIFYVFM